MSLGYRGHKQIASTACKKFCANKRWQNIFTWVFSVRIGKYEAVTFSLFIFP